MVPGDGLEPSRGISPADFESAASTNFATQAFFESVAVSNRTQRIILMNEIVASRLNKKFCAW